MVKIDVQIVRSWPTQDILELYKAGNWWKPEYNPDGIPDLIKHSYAFAVAIDCSRKKAVGMARLISDGISDAYIQDTIVLPQYRRHDVGTQLISVLLDCCEKHHIKWIGLIAEPGSQSFYKTLGFHEMKKHTPMLYKS